jgi:capsid protein
MPRDVVPSTADDALFIAQAMPWIDPLKEANAYTKLVRAGFASEAEVMRKRGVNPRDTLEQIATFRRQAAERGLIFTSDGAHSESAGAPKPRPAPAPGRSARAGNDDADDDGDTQDDTDDDGR